jgi:tRNA pseudouridine38-40 synthase
MQEAADMLVGEHDFATFGSPPQGTNTVRRVLSADWTQDGSQLCLEVTANAFLYRMVRSIVGTLLQVGQAALSIEAFAARFAAAERSQSGPVAPAHGLCLMAVEYEGVP